MVVSTGRNGFTVIGGLGLLDSRQETAGHRTRIPVAEPHRVGYVTKLCRKLGAFCWSQFVS
jgi:hypothetical protein